MQSELEWLLEVQMEEKNFPPWEAEYKFLNHRRFRFDFCWPDLKFAVEVEGGTWQNGRHSRGSGFEKDCEKYNEAILEGYHVLRVTANQVKDGRAVNWIERYLLQHEQL